MIIKKKKKNLRGFVIFFKNKKAKWRYANISDTPFDQRSLILREAWFLDLYYNKKGLNWGIIN